MEDETAGPPVRKALSATAPAFKFSVSMEVPTEEEPATNGVTEGFSFNPESQEYTGKVPAKGEEEDKKDKKKFRTEDDLYLAEVLLAGETDGLLQDPSAGSVTDVNNHPFNSVLTPNFWDPSEKHDRASGNSGRHVFVMASLDPGQWQNGESFVGSVPGSWGQPPSHAGASSIGSQPHPSVNSGHLVRHAGNQRQPYPGAPGNIYPLPIGPHPVHPGLGPRPLYSQAHNPPKFPDGAQGYPQGPNIVVYNGTEVIAFTHTTLPPLYPPLAQHPRYPPAMPSLPQEMNQSHAPRNDMNQRNGSYNAPNQHSQGKGDSGLPPLPDLKFLGRRKPGVRYLPRASKSHYTDIAPTDSNVNGSGDGGKGGKPELKSRGVFLRSVPRIASHFEIFQNIRGGTIDQVSFQDCQGSLVDINIFFTTHKAAKAYVNYVTDHGGVFWHSERFPSDASLIPSRDSGFLNMDKETARAIRNNFTRCISITRIPPHITESQMRADIQSQTRRFKIEYEAFEFRYVDSIRGRTAMAEIRFPSVKICMASIAILRGFDAYKGCIMTPSRDECAGPLSELEHKWRTEYEWWKSQGVFRDQRFPVAISRDKEGGRDGKGNRG